MLRILMRKVDNMQEQMDTIIKEDRNTLRRNQRQMLKIKSIILIEMKNIFNGLISRLDMVKERKSELENLSIENFPN